MLAKMICHPASISEATAQSHPYLLVVLGQGAGMSQEVPFQALLAAQMKRKKKKLDTLGKTPFALQTPSGGLCVFVVHDPHKTQFQRFQLMRQALALLLAESAQRLGLAFFNPKDEREAAASDALYCAWVNGTPLPTQKSEDKTKALERIELYGVSQSASFAHVKSKAEGNVLCRELTVLPPNTLTPGQYRKRLRVLARSQRWSYEEYDYQRLLKMGAGAFCAVAQGSEPQDAAIVHLQWRSPGAKKTVALVGKGICFDTGGHNLKPARYMQGMHEDMNGSAVALGILRAVSEAQLNINIDCWLALAQNHLSPKAYKQNDVVRAFNGTTIEIVHTDAEGRMVLADTLSLAARKKPDLMIDFATLTGSMHVALGSRYSGFFATQPELIEKALEAGSASGERVSCFPLDEDYDSALDSTVADVKQCTLDGEADHILAALLLKRFTDQRDWIHMDLSAHSCKGGLGAVNSDVTGFGVSWAFHLLSRL